MHSYRRCLWTVLANDMYHSIASWQNRWQGSKQGSKRSDVTLQTISWRRVNPENENLIENDATRKDYICSIHRIHSKACVTDQGVIKMVYIRQQKLEDLHNYKYAGVDHSLTSKYILKPFYTNVVIKCFPMSMA